LYLVLFLKRDAKALLEGVGEPVSATARGIDSGLPPGLRLLVQPHALDEINALVNLRGFELRIKPRSSFRIQGLL
jgi:hypothetical protein